MNAAEMIDFYFELEAAVELVAPEGQQWMGQYIPLEGSLLNWAEVTRNGDYRWLRANHEETYYFSERVGPTVYLRENDGATTREVVFNSDTLEVDEYMETSGR